MKIKFFAAALALVSGMCVNAAVVEVSQLTEPLSAYLIHTSGNHLGPSGDKKAIIKSPTAPNAAKLTFTPVDGEWFTITTADGKYLNQDGSYSLNFVDAANGNRTQYKFESAGSGLLKVKCRQTKYLGTDGIGLNASVFSDKSGEDTRHFWFVADDPQTEIPVVTYSYIINPDAERQTIEGWGVSLCWWANMCGKWDDEKIDEIVDWLVSPEGLNFNIFRYNIGGGDDPDNANCTPHHMGNGKGLRAEMEGFKDSSDGDYIWTRDAAQRKIMLKIKEKRPDAIFEAFSNSAPWYMTYSGCCAGNSPSSKDNLKPEYYEEFANYLVDVCKHYKDEYGIEFKTLDPFNEPMTSYWGKSGGQEGCHFDVQSMIDFVKVLSPILKKSGLKTVISATDETSTEQSVKDFIAFRKAGILDLVGQWNTHTYTVNTNARTQLAALCQEENMPLWMSEVGLGGAGINGNLSLAQKLVDDVRHIMPSAWIDWQYIEEGNDQWCLVKSTAKFEAQQYAKVKNYFIRQHFSKYFKVGYTYLTCLDGHTLAARSADGKTLVITSINSGLAPVVYNADVSMFAKVSLPRTAIVTDPDNDAAAFTDYELTGEGVFTYTMPAQSVVTFEIPVEIAPVQTGLQAGVPYLIIPRRNPAVVLTATPAGGVKIDACVPSAAQQWTLDGADGKYTLTNAEGTAIAIDGENYALATGATGTTFAVTPVGKYYYKITDVDGVKGFDLEGENSSAGANVGVWDYAADAPTHRQWAFVTLPAKYSGIEDVTVDGADRAEDLFTLSVADSVLTVTPAAPALVSVCNAAGVSLYSRNVDAAVSLPLTPGFYVVSCATLAATASRTVVVR